MNAVAHFPARQPAPLHDLEAEQALIAKLCIDNRSIEAVSDKLKPEDFHEEIFGHIYSLIAREHSAGKPVNVLTLRPHLEGIDAFEQMGGMRWLAGLTTNPLANLIDKASADHLSELAARRRLVENLALVSDMASDTDQTIESVIDEADAALVQAVERGEAIHQPTGAECIAEVLAGLDQPVQGVTCRVIPSMDKLLGHLRPKQLTILAARPGMGKTAVAISYALGAAQNGYGVLFVSLEMGSTELGQRMAADLCFDGQRGVPFSAIREANLSSDQIRKVTSAGDMLRDMPFRVIDVGSMTMGRLNMLVRRYKRRMAAQGQSLDLVIVDYLQLVNPNGKTGNRYEAVSEVSRGMKQLAKEHSVSVMALAQLSRAVESRPDKRPTLADLRESGQLEQDADNVLFLLRDEYYHRKEEPEKGTPDYRQWFETLEKCRGKIEFILAKARNSVEGVAMGAFHGAFQAVRGVE